MKTLLVGIYLVDSNIGKESKDKVDSTVAMNELLCLKNAGAQISMVFTSNEYYWHPMAIEKIKILGAVLELPARKQYQSNPFTSKWAELAVLFS